jgi:hypothetical protein
MNALAISLRSSAAFLLAVLLLGCSVGGDPDADSTPGPGPGTPNGTGGTATPSEIEEGCEPTRKRPGPVIDLAVQSGGVGPGRGPLPKARVNALVKRASAAGATVVSTIASWTAQQPRAYGAYDWSAMDDVIDAARARNLEVRVIVQTTPAWARDERGKASRWVPPRTAAELERWRDYLTELVSHVAGRVQYVQIWTDPNASRAWVTGPDPGEYAELLHVSYAAVKAVAPRMKVISGGLSGNALGFLEKVYEYRHDRLGDEPLFDYLGLHPSTHGRAPGVGPDVYDQPPFGRFDQSFLGYRLVRDVMVQNGDAGVPIYIGRFGYRTAGATPVSDSTRASFVSEAYELANCDRYVAALSWYLMHPVPWDEPDWALLDAQGRPNLTYDALQAWSQRFAEVRNGHS